MNRLSLQDQHFARGHCFGCGPTNERGLRLKSYVDGDEVVATFQPEKHHEAFDNCVCGGIVSSLLDCHSYWAATHALLRQSGTGTAPSLVTTELNVKFLRPAPSTEPLELRARVVSADAGRAEVESTLAAGGKICATCRGSFVAVKPGHPAYREE